MIMIYFYSFLSQVTEEVLSVLRLLHPLTESSPLQASHGESRLDVALTQLQNVARNLAMSHTKQVQTTPTLKQSSLSYSCSVVGMLLWRMLALCIWVEIKERWTGVGSANYKIFLAMQQGISIIRCRCVYKPWGLYRDINAQMIMLARVLLVNQFPHCFPVRPLGVKAQLCGLTTSFYNWQYQWCESFWYLLYVREGHKVCDWQWE